jgi:alpha-N-arabinofuranosidase
MSELSVAAEGDRPVDVSATIEIDPTREIGRVDPNIFGHFLESNFFGNIEGGIFDEGSPLALPGPGAAAGLRGDVIDACQELGMPVVRWPGGNFTSAYHWEDGVGPREARPRRLDLTWRGEESNRFGTDEFLAWCHAVGAEPYLAHSCRDVDEAVRWVEYTNYPGNTAYTAARAANGRREPYGVRYWGLGNEVYGPWQMGHRPAAAYAADAREHALFMRRVDPSLQLIAVGAQAPAQEEWARALLPQAGDLIDFVSLHLYAASTHLAGEDDYDAVVTQPRYFEDQIASCAELLDAVASEAGVQRPLSIALDEWNIRHLEPAHWPDPRPGANGGVAPRDIGDSAGRQPERFRVNRYSSRTLADALFYAGVFNVLYRLCGLPVAVRMANTVNLVNANALIEVRPEGLVKSATYHVWDLYQNHLGRRVVPVRVTGPAKTVPVRQGAAGNSGNFSAKSATLPALDVVATIADDGRALRVAVLNRDRHHAIAARLASVGPTRELPPDAHLRDLGVGVDDVWAVNRLGLPAQVGVIDRGVRGLPDGRYVFAPHSLTVVEWSL